MAAAYQRISGGRLLLNIVTGGEPPSRPGSATPTRRRPATRGPRSSSRCCAARGSRPPFDFKGSSSRSRARWSRAGSSPRPDIYFGGSSGPGRTGGGQARRRLPDLGRAPGAGGREAGLDAVAGPRAGADPPLRAARPHDLPRHQRGRVAARAVAARRPRPGAGRGGAGGAPGQRVDRAGPDAGAARRAGRRTTTRASSRSPPGCGPASAWSAAAPGPRWSAATTRWPTGWPSTTPWASTSSSCPATRTSRRRTGSARASAPAPGPRPARRRQATRHRTAVAGIGADRAPHPPRLLGWVRGRRDLGCADAHPHAPRRHLHVVRLPAARAGRRAEGGRVHPDPGRAAAHRHAGAAHRDRGRRRRLGGAPGLQPVHVGGHHAGRGLGGLLRGRRAT